MDNYIKKAQKLMADGVIPDGSIGNLAIQHDSWCKRLRGVGECNCDPDITYYEASSPEDFASTFIALTARGPKN